MTVGVINYVRTVILNDSRAQLAVYQKSVKKNARIISEKIKDMKEFRAALSSDCVVGYVRRFAIDRIAENRRDIKQLSYENAINKRVITYYQRVVSRCVYLNSQEEEKNREIKKAIEQIKNMIHDHGDEGVKQA